MAIKRIASNKTAAHSVRTTDELWTKAKRRAEAEGVTMNFVINEILEGYSRGLMNLPRVTKQYAPAAKN